MGHFASFMSRRTFLSRTIGGLVGYGVLTERLSADIVEAQAASAGDRWPQYKADAGHSGRVERGVGPTGDIKEVQIEAFDDLFDHTYDGVAVSGETVYIGSRDLVAINTATGQSKWSFEPTVPAHDYPEGDAGADVGHPAVVDGTVYAGVAFVGPGGRPSTYDSALIAVDAITGEQRWRYDTPGGVTYDEFSIVTVAADTVVTSVSGEDGHATRTVIAFTTDGNERWRTQIEEMFAGALPVSDGKVYIPSAAGIQALDLATEEVVWTALPNVRFTSAATPMVADGTLFVAEEGEPGVTLIALDVTTGEEHWRTAYTPAAYPGMTIGTADDDRVYLTVNGIEGTVIALNRADGSERWRTTIEQPAEGTIPLDGFALVGGVLYNGAAALHPSDGSIIWTHTLPVTGTGWRLGAVADGRGYLYGKQLAVLTGTTKQPPDPTHTEPQPSTPPTEPTETKPPGTTTNTTTTPTETPLTETPTAATTTTGREPTGTKTPGPTAVATGTPQPPMTDTATTTTTTDGPGFGVLSAVAGVGLITWRSLTRS